MDSQARAASAAPSVPAADMPGGDPAVEVPTFRELFRGEFGGMVALARLLGSDDPENTAQEAFLRLHTRWDSLRDPAAAANYLRTTVVRLSRNRIRHLGVVRRHAARHRERQQPSAEAEALRRADTATVIGALRRLPERQRSALVLRYFLELPFSEIAAALRCPAATARSDVRRGLATLARILDAAKEPEGEGS